MDIEFDDKDIEAMNEAMGYLRFGYLTGNPNFDGMYERMEQILSKMRELQGLKPDDKGIQIGDNNIQVNTFK